MNLTDLSVKRLRVNVNGRTTYNDDVVPGFGVRVSANGVKTFAVVVGRNRKRITIGRYPTITLQEARARAREIIAERVLGKDDVPSMKFEDAIPIFLTSRYGDNYIKPRTRDEVERLLRRHFLPKFRHEQLSVIKTHEIADIIDILRKTPSIAHHAFGAIRLFFRWAEGRRYVLRSPCAILQPPRPSRPRERVLSQNEIRTVLRTARGNTSTFSTIVELLLLTGQRRGEIAALRHDWIDFERRSITFPGKITKNKRSHTIPFGTRVHELLLRGQPKGLLFPARGTDNKNPFDGWSKCKPKFDDLCSLDHWTLHDLRRTFATNLAAIGVPIHVTEKLLNHTSGTLGGIVAVYQRHSYAREMREAMDSWEKEVAQLSRKSGQAEFHAEDLHVEIAA
jgi:integrase